MKLNVVCPNDGERLVEQTANRLRILAVMSARAPGVLPEAWRRPGNLGEAEAVS